ncbi:hypothetical protein COS93_00225 [bacterium (Candidatus Gribaldobacteria) CG07_land_8_20_14_0_80_33_18]|uniref:Methyltransferase domain-containing protein n=1 Tax=bacterium (Candidatus Gribaldobacteria) CG07_land_8_20_14_0_80_33_18 TaxID=2014272 RepID=A0A2M6Z4M9_9BACT|nr:MAG: hypothetical protein COU04_02160 [bacterium (Candidatus Gribaldobacteria) CG10_big_fil_rev_8_21_14_0_10_33_41]PIU47277.1 MAG: hypothetical protein COS93_00225 [bacterium (Candidatus Gribaldobacteria) CG07_land_8_20_14_0_80_33_18]PJA00986.1 MAG: hypothetical protein COX75_01225 [bacterium (Candidatus Gribaldobacteria) CG_4_10_14_0_2_um_filter_33_15]PJB08741.1 MAG: hypothetical protein CO122_01115 [bacterium (Candidatus Gribaldobacteria) CG_4_9_14_3_um_filter_33_9]
MPDFINPDKILEQLNLKPEMTAVDFGCGSGGWAIPLAKRLKDGKVYAIDIQEEPLSVLISKAALEKITNIQPIQADVEDKDGIKIYSSSCDLVLITNLLFQTEDDEQIFKEAERILKPKGIILVIDWESEITFGPKGKRISVEEVEKIAEKFNLKLEKKFKAGNFHYGLIFRK